MAHKQDAEELKRLARGRWPEVLSELGGVDVDRLDGRNHPCPKCGGKDRFRLIDEDAGALFCNQCFSSDNGDGIAALQWLCGWSFTETLDKLAEKLGVGGSSCSTPKTKTSHPKEVARYEYRDESGELLFQKVRYEPKTFRQRAPKPGGEWNYSLKDVRKVLYRLPGLLEAGSEETIFVVEGEKDVDRLHGLGLLATCNFDGAGKWLDDYTESLVDKNVVILSDNDDGGRAHGELVASKLEGRAASIRVVELPDLPEKGDVSDWLDAGGTVEELMEIVEEAEPWEPSPSDGSEPFPLDALPEVVRRYVEEASDALGCDPAFVAVPLLAVLAAAIGDSCVIELKATWQEPPILWAAIIAPSASQKTPAIKLALAPLHPINRSGFHDHKKALEEYEQDMLLYEGALADWKRKGRKNDDPPPEKPQKPECKRYIVSDITLEALAERLDTNPHGLLVFVDELAGWVGSFDAYRSGSNKDESSWLAIHSGSPLTVDRKTGKPTIYVERPIVSIIGGIQPGVFAELFGGRDGKQKSESGMTQRLLICEPPLQAKTWKPDAIISEPTQAAIFEVVETLVELSPSTKADGELVPYVIHLDHNAKVVWGRFYDAHAQETHNSTGAIRAHWGKLEAYAARLALVLHLVGFASNEDAPTKINTETMTAGIRLARWFGSEAQRIYSDILMVDGGVDTKERDLIEWIEKHGHSTSVRDLTRGPSAYKGKGGAKKAETALNTLVKKGVGVWVVDSHGGGKGRPGQVFALSDSDRNRLIPEKNGFVSPSPPDEKRKPTDTPIDGESGGGLLI